MEIEGQLPARLLGPLLELLRQSLELDAATVERMSGQRTPARYEARGRAMDELAQSGRAEIWKQVTGTIGRGDFMRLPSTVRHAAYDTALAILVADRLPAVELRPLVAMWRAGGAAGLQLTAALGI